MTAAAYTRLEVLRTFRNRRFFIFSLIFPLAMYLLLAGPNRGETDFLDSGISAPLYYMVGLISFGTMVAVIAGGARIAAERSVGWNRQLRLTPLSVPAYFRTKILTGYLMACVSIVLLYVAGIGLGVSMPLTRWLEMTGLILVALVPFAVLGIAMGHLLTVDSMGPALGGVTSLFAFIGGTWFPITGDGWLSELARWIPSYWLVKAGQIGAGGASWSARGWLVIALWSIVLAAVAARVYRRDTTRV
ncbi:MAG: ABC transporter permease [Thermoleophilia bacterium]